jgi:uncharacterized protein YuzE
VTTARSPGRRSVRVTYDRECDVLYITLGRSQMGYHRPDPAVPSLNLRYSVKDNTVCGATILFYSGQDRDLVKSRLPFPVSLPEVVLARPYITR